MEAKLELFGKHSKKKMMSHFANLRSSVVTLDILDSLKSGKKLS